jgi:hypothetical protein
MSKTKYSEHLQWLHDRFVNHYHENENVDYLIKMREIIEYEKEVEKGFARYMDWLNKNKGTNHKI